MNLFGVVYYDSMKKETVEPLKKNSDHFMRFEEYCGIFEGDFFGEGRKLLGSHVEAYSRLQKALEEYPTFCRRESHLRTIRELYRIAVTTGVKDLVSRVDPHTPWIAEEINGRLEGKQIVDVGCCNGFFTIFYAINHPEAQFIGIDLSEDALESARKKASDSGVKNIRWICGDVLDLNMRSELGNTNSIILQDVLYQLFGSRDQQKELKMLQLLRQREGSIAIIAQEGNDLRSKSTVAHDEGYVLDSYRQETMFDRNVRSNITYGVAIFRKRDTT